MKKILAAILLCVTSLAHGQAFQQAGPSYTYSLGQPIGVAPTGTMGANGALTSGTALPATYSGGIWLYFPAGAVFSGSSAGFFWCVMSTTTAGTCYTNTYTYNSTDPKAIPSSPTAVSDAGPGAYTGTTGDINFLTINIPGGKMGPNGVAIVKYQQTMTSNANAKTTKLYFGGSQIYSFNPSSQTTSTQIIPIHNKNNVSRQSGPATGVANPIGNSNAGPNHLAINTGNDVAVAMVATHSTATDAIVIEWMDVSTYFAP